MSDVIVVGGGISGLTAAWKLSRAGLDVTLLEEKPDPGGHTRTIASGGYRMDAGAHSFPGSSETVWRLAAELGLSEEVEAARDASRKRYIYRDGRLHALPLGPGSFVSTRLLSAKAKLRLMAEPFIPGGGSPDETAWEFFRRRFGEEAATFVMGPFVSGIYAGDVRLLGARAAFPKFWQFENDAGSMIRGAVGHMRRKRKRLAKEGLAPRRGLFSFRGGLGRITAKLVEDLGTAVETGRRVERITPSGDGFEVEGGRKTWRSRAVIVATPPRQTASILGEALPEIVEPLERVPMASVTVVHWSPDVPYDTVPAGFGFLMPRFCGLRVLGTVFASHLFSGRAPEGRLLFSSFYGGMLDPGAVDLDDAALASLVFAEHETIFGVPLGPRLVLRVLRHREAIPQLTPDHPERMALLERARGKLPRLFLAGNYLTGVGVEHATESGYRAAEKCLASLRGA